MLITWLVALSQSQGDWWVRLAFEHRLHRANNLTKNTTWASLVQKPDWPPLLDCYCQKTGILLKGRLSKYLWAWSLEKERSKSSRTQPRDWFTPRYTLVLCLRVEYIGRQSAVLSVMEMIGEGTLVTTCGSIHWENNKVLMTQLSLPKSISRSNSNILILGNVITC